MAEAHAKHHDYHLVNPSPWPLVGSIAAFVLAIGGIWYMHNKETPHALWAIAPGLALVLYTMMHVVARRASTKPPPATTRPVVQLHLRYGMMLFIASEVMFFVAWFWAYFDVALFPGDAAPVSAHRSDGRRLAAARHRDLRSLAPAAAQHADPADLGHDGHLGAPRLLHGDRKGAQAGLLLTIVLGVLFSRVPGLRIQPRRHSAISGNIYGSTFFMATGFHGFHVIVGTIFLAVCLFRLYGRVHPAAAFRLRGGRLVLALRRRGLAVPVRLDLCLGLWRPGGRRGALTIDPPPCGEGDCISDASGERGFQCVSESLAPLSRLGLWPSRLSRRGERRPK